MLTPTNQISPTSAKPAINSKTTSHNTTQSQAIEDSVATQRFPVAVFVIQTQEDKSIIVKEDSGEAIDEPDASNSNIQSKSLYESASKHEDVTLLYLSPMIWLLYLFKNIEVLHLQSIISSEQKFRKPFKRALAADLLVILISYGPSSGIRAVSHTVEAVVHLRSLGVLTAAGCGIGSVHAVVRSNLLVEPSEVEEGEM
ncbi:hypothetical protein F511_19326 [Dorcoceras hygrometricum]|uniref:Uncharacterized protein n=1 Tax=Dorcoceras hygrometricum TaxID=472368 RepID=A0A2Z7BJX1_9LAMI|nr:hypothetical protein F511_19326 [Dorcoceras hygrometricum]